MRVKSVMMNDQYDTQTTHDTSYSNKNDHTSVHVFSFTIYSAVKAFCNSTLSCSMMISSDAE